MTTGPEARAKSAFIRSFGQEPTHVVRAPGRVNLIGEHTDYNDGFVLPIALARATYVAVRGREDRKVRITAADFGDQQDVFDLDQPISLNLARPWANYVRGVAATLQDVGWSVGADLAVAGDIPQGSGLSSSASLEVAAARALLSVQSEVTLSTQEIARLAQRAECDFVGCKCGIMDQLASAFDRQGEALLIDCRDLHTQTIPVPHTARVMIVHSGVTRGLVEGRYNERRSECEAAARHLGVSHLRDVTLEELEAEGGRLGTLAFKRARHVVTENARVLQAAAALRVSDLPSLGVLMNASHVSMRDDFAITTPEIDRLVQIIEQALGKEGGVRMTGGGFGGAVVAVGAKEDIERASRAALNLYRTPTGSAPLVLFEP